MKTSYNGSPPVVSIMFPTYNREGCVRAALRSVASLNYPPDKYEVIVIDDGSNDGTERTVRLMQDGYDAKILYFRQERKGITAARNLGIAKASGELLIFTDDDCTFEKDWIWELLRYNDSPNVGAVGGPDKGPLDASFFARCVDYTTTSFIGTGGVRRKAGFIVARYYPRGCNMMVPRNVIDLVGMFDPSLEAGEEIELGYRIRKAGFKLAYAPTAMVWHKRRDNLVAFVRQMFTRGQTRIELAKRHRELLELSYFIPPVVLFCVFMLSLLLLFCPAMIQTFEVPFLVACAILLAAGTHGAIQLRDARAVGAIPLLLGLQYLMYGAGFVEALFRNRAHFLSFLSK